MKIKAKIDRMVNSGNVKAIASVSLDGMFVVLMFMLCAMAIFAA